MRFAIAPVAVGLHALARPVGEPRALQGVAKRRAVIAVPGLVDILLAQKADEGSAADERAEMALLVAPGRDVDAHVAHIRILTERPRRLEPVDDAERTIEPAGMVLAFDMRAGEKMRTARAAVADHGADAVDARVQPGLFEPVAKPMARLDVLRREGRAMHAGLVSAEGRQRAEVAKDAVGIDGRHHALGCHSGGAKRRTRNPRGSATCGACEWVPGSRFTSPGTPDIAVAGKHRRRDHATSAARTASTRISSVNRALRAEKSGDVFMV